MKKRGFTLIEVMIVIAVFSIGVLAVLRMVLYNMNAMDTIRIRTTATFLAKEGMAMVYNIRDTNRMAGLPWDCVANTDYSDINSNNICEYNLISGSNNKIWKIGFAKDKQIYVEGVENNIIFDDKFESTKLYLMSGNQVEMYDYENNGTPSIYARYVLFTGVLENDKILPKDRIVKVESHVLFRKGSLSGDVVLESFIGNY